jgi:hypothetical protein
VVAPTGHTYITKTEGAHWYPKLATPTRTPDITEQPLRAPLRDYCMRKRTRAQERQALINETRMFNEEHITDNEWHRRPALEKTLAAEDGWDEPAPF